MPQVRDGEQALYNAADIASCILSCDLQDSKPTARVRHPLRRAWETDEQHEYEYDSDKSWTKSYHQEQQAYRTLPCRWISHVPCQILCSYEHDPNRIASQAPPSNPTKGVPMHVHVCHISEVSLGRAPQYRYVESVLRRTRTMARYIVILALGDAAPLDQKQDGLSGCLLGAVLWGNKFPSSMGAIAKFWRSEPNCTGSLAVHEFSSLGGGGGGRPHRFSH